MYRDEEAIMYTANDLIAMNGKALDVLKVKLIKSGIPSSTAERLNPSQLAIALNNLR